MPKHKHPIPLFKAVLNEERSRIHRAYGHGGNFNEQDHKKQYLLEYAYYAHDPMVLVDVLEGGALTQLPTCGSNITLLCAEVLANKTAKSLKADLLITAGASLTDADKVFLEKYKEMNGFKPNTKFYVEQVETGKARRPTVKSIENDYNVEFDLNVREKRLKNYEVAITESEKPTFKVSFIRSHGRQEHPSPEQAKTGH